MKVNIDISCKCFSLLVYQRSVQLLHETLDTLIKALTAFTVRQFSFVGRQTDKSKDQAPKQHHYLGRNNNPNHPNHLPPPKSIF